jgi:hypothetical protein
MREQEVLTRIKDELEQTLCDIPFLQIGQSVLQAPLTGGQVDLLVELKAKNRLLRVLVEVKSLGEPRVIRSAIQQLREYTDRIEDTYAVVAAPYISDDTAHLCPMRSWQVQELAKEANVSLGLASRVKERLLDLEYACEKDKTIVLSRPSELLEQWANNYSFRKNKVYDYFGFDEPRELERKLSRYCKQRETPYALTLFSGAALVAPFARYARGFAYVGQSIKEVVDSLGLKEVSSGPNFSILEPYDEGVFYGSREIDDMKVVSDIQLYLDLVGFKGRGEESAIFLLEQRIKTQW